VKLKSYKSLWGMEGSLERQFERIAAAGYDGIESPLPKAIEHYFGFPAEEKLFCSLLERYDLKYIAMVITEDEDHEASFRHQVEQAVTFDPVMINSHSAKDRMTFDKQLSFFEKAQAVEQKYKVPIGHETHRGRAMYSPWNTAVLLREYPELKLTADFSHWVCVCESLLEDQKENMLLAIQRVIHIHARVGYTQGPQVPHPGAPEYATELNAHEEWWKQVMRKHADGGTQLSFTPEFGPNPYMPRLAFTNQPVSDLWEVCLWMKSRFEQLI